jgi:hypothetical protein
MYLLTSFNLFLARSLDTEIQRIGVTVPMRWAPRFFLLIWEEIISLFQSWQEHITLVLSCLMVALNAGEEIFMVRWVLGKYFKALKVLYSLLLSDQSNYIIL